MQSLSRQERLAFIRRVTVNHWRALERKRSTSEFSVVSRTDCRGRKMIKVNWDESRVRGTAGRSSRLSSETLCAGLWSRFTKDKLVTQRGEVT